MVDQPRSRVVKDHAVAHVELEHIRPLPGRVLRKKPRGLRPRRHLAVGRSHRESSRGLHQVHSTERRIFRTATPEPQLAIPAAAQAFSGSSRAHGQLPAAGASRVPRCPDGGSHAPRGSRSSAGAWPPWGSRGPRATPWGSPTATGLASSGTSPDSGSPASRRPRSRAGSFAGHGAAERRARGASIGRRWPWCSCWTHLLVEVSSAMTEAGSSDGGPEGGRRRRYLLPGPVLALVRRSRSPDLRRRLAPRPARSSSVSASAGSSPSPARIRRAVRQGCVLRGRPEAAGGSPPHARDGAVRALDRPRGAARGHDRVRGQGCLAPPPR